MEIFVTILKCAKDGCMRMISVYILPGGNPIAKAKPDLFSDGYKTCKKCSAPHCDKHFKQKCLICGGKLGSVLGR